MTDNLNQEQLQLSKVFKKDWNFVAGADNHEQLPGFLYDPEIAFIGKSNVGKSSLMFQYRVCVAIANTVTELAG